MIKLREKKYRLYIEQRAYLRTTRPRKERRDTRDAGTLSPRRRKVRRRPDSVSPSLFSAPGSNWSRLELSEELFSSKQKITIGPFFFSWKRKTGTQRETDRTRDDPRRKALSTGGWFPPPKRPLRGRSGKTILLSYSTERVTLVMTRSYTTSLH